jgi:DNA-directed RNA polymerase specialized sigma24 family protein
MTANEPEELLAIDDVLNELAANDKLAAELVKLHFFAGLPIEQAAEALDLSRTTAYRLWAYARAWLRDAVERDSEASPP